MKTDFEINVVLVRPHYSRNVGSVSRAMANMGAQRLILIDPKCEINLEARQGASGAQTHLLERTNYSSWSEFFSSEREGVRIAFCGTPKKETDTLPLAQRLRQLLVDGEQPPSQPVFLIFGQEDHGLENEDIQYANFICRLPTFGDFTSLNLSHAVLLALFITKGVFEETGPAGDIASTRLAENGDDGDHFHFPEESLQRWLNTLGFEIGERRTDVFKVLKRILLRNLASAKELRILEAIVNQTIRKLKN